MVETDTSPSARPVLQYNVNVVFVVLVAAAVLASAGEEYAARLAMMPNNVTDRTTRRTGASSNKSLNSPFGLNRVRGSRSPVTTEFVSKIVSHQTKQRR